MFTGRTNIAAGFLFLALFMLYGFFLGILRDFAPGKEQWIADYAVGVHFQARLAHAHGNLFALINIAVGLVLLHLPRAASSTRWVSGLALAGMLMPLGILVEIQFGGPPVLVFAGGLAMILAMTWLAAAFWRTEMGQ